MSNWVASVAATGAATASTVSTETNNVLTIFIYPGKDSAERATSLSTFIQSHTHSHLGAVTHSSRQPPALYCSPPNCSAEANTMFRALLVRQSNNCIKFGVILWAHSAVLWLPNNYYSVGYMGDSTVQAHGYWRPLTPGDLSHITGLQTVGAQGATKH